MATSERDGSRCACSSRSTGGRGIRHRPSTRRSSSCSRSLPAIQRLRPDQLRRSRKQLRRERLSRLTDLRYLNLEPSLRRLQLPRTEPVAQPALLADRVLVAPALIARAANHASNSSSTARWMISRAPSFASSESDSRGFSPIPTDHICSILASISADGGRYSTVRRCRRRRRSSRRAPWGTRDNRGLQRSGADSRRRPSSRCRAARATPRRAAASCSVVVQRERARRRRPRELRRLLVDRPREHKDDSVDVADQAGPAV